MLNYIHTWNNYYIYAFRKDKNERRVWGMTEREGSFD